MSDEGPCCSTQSQKTAEASSSRVDRRRESNDSSPTESSTPLTCNEADAEGEEDLVDLCRRLDTQLEEKAKMHNLNALNVKSILHVGICIASF
ncbi:hypothetical protein ANCDUO_08500 [Ancylostoma duodenale]|uniref:Uncharacterized protein n=1 Tax=Ancylostoma duodenale TaxID=51022 RepID=A0A0C2GQ59_9BILA|nr:hypothetical protein ANCDUO_08500 [Ancylostoma duodenale]